MEIAENLHLITDLEMSNACLVTGPEPTLFDTGLPGDGRRILAYLGQVGLEPRDLRAIALTHADPAHAGSAAWLRRETAARLYASPAEAAVLAGQVPDGNLRTLWRWGLRLTRRPMERCLVDATLEEGDEVAGFQVLATPGHTLGHISFYRPSDGVLIAGDALRVSGADILAPSFWNSASEVRARVSVAHLADLPVSLVVPGHGNPYREPGAWLRRVGGPPGVLEETLRRRELHRQRRARRSGSGAASVGDRGGSGAPPPA
jgi:glyoxylase-like metal-dependent hydrolase (beta-lactamase superfamily II)